MGELLTAQELAKYLKLNPVTILRKAAKREVPAIKIGKQFRFDKDQIVSWLAENKVGRKLRVLVVDDEPVIVHLFNETLSKYGYQVTAILNSSEALKLITAQKFDLIFLDLAMPEIDGSELFRQIRQTDNRIPVAIITGYPDSELMAKAMQHGPFMVMKKPFGSTDILNAISVLSLK
ncbi:MAG TPA: response regulator [Dehalococcoidia bacterium]|nr:response regulator [Dehalococcoidia bacterium]